MKIFKAIASIVLTITVLVIAIVAMVTVPKQQCSQVLITPHTDNESVVLTADDVTQLIATAGIPTVGQKVKEVDVAGIQHLLQSNPYVKKVNFVHFAGSKLIIDYTLRKLILHVFNNGSEQYFVDDEGYLVPYTPKMKDYLMVANGRISQKYKTLAQASGELKPVVQLANEILSDDFDAAQYRQIYVGSDCQLSLVSTIGHHKIRFGTVDNSTEKLENLRNVYKSGLARKGYDTYASLDVRYKNRVIAQRKQ